MLKAAGASSIEVRADYRCLLTTTTSAFTVADLSADGGSAVIVHTGTDDPGQGDESGARISVCALR
ncbi:hypothetical protein ACIA8C_18395 [Nocardia sp. NPDC051321]|uniref:hypothetical protein n=1 Tax=Nocardia sp. NPDC051321 TaxID=3364323 RepID=UPI0037985EFF